MPALPFGTVVWTPGSVLRSLKIADDLYLVFAPNWSRVSILLKNTSRDRILLPLSHPIIHVVGRKIGLFRLH